MRKVETRRSFKRNFSRIQVILVLDGLGGVRENFIQSSDCRIPLLIESSHRKPLTQVDDPFYFSFIFK